MKNWLRLTASSASLLLTGLLPLTAAAAGPWEISIYGGNTWHHDSDVDVRTPAVTATFGNVAWRSDSFGSPPHWGVRFGRWFGEGGRLGIALDFVHAKVIAEEGETVQVNGTRNGAAVNTSELLGNTFTTFEYTDGLNLGTLNLLYRWPNLAGRFTPYVGVGLGAAVPHVEVTSPGVNIREYQLAGVTAHGLAGISATVCNWVNVFAEYKAGYTDLEADLPGGSLSHDLFSHHIDFGLSFTF